MKLAGEKSSDTCQQNISGALLQNGVAALSETSQVDGGSSSGKI